jgi:hypothetical protein
LHDGSPRQLSEQKRLRLILVDSDYAGRFPILYTVSRKLLMSNANRTHCSSLCFAAGRYSSFQPIARLMRLCFGRKSTHHDHESISHLNQITFHRDLGLGDVNDPGIGNNHVYLEQMRNVHGRPHRSDQRCTCARANFKLKPSVIHPSTFEPSRQKLDGIGSFQQLASSPPRSPTRLLQSISAG